MNTQYKIILGAAVLIGILLLIYFVSFHASVDPQGDQGAVAAAITTSSPATPPASSSPRSATTSAPAVDSPAEVSTASDPNVHAIPADQDPANQISVPSPATPTPSTSS